MPAQIDRAAVLADVVAVVRSQAAEGNADACFLEKPARIAGRVDFLSPFEFLVATIFDQEPSGGTPCSTSTPSTRVAPSRDSARRSPRRAQATMTALAYYDVNSDRIRVNTARAGRPASARPGPRVLARDAPRPDLDRADGRTLRANGFWLQEQRHGRRSGSPSRTAGLAVRLVPPRRGDGDPDGDALRRAVAVCARRPPGGDAFLGRLMGVAGSEVVLRQYLDSRPYELGALTEAHHASFPELQVVARP